MKKLFSAFIISLLVGLILASGCIGGDGNVDKWNDGVEEANNYVLNGHNLYDDIIEYHSLGQYQTAIQKADDTILQYEQALVEVDNLYVVSADIGEDFLDDYLDAWKNVLNELISAATARKMLSMIEQYNILRTELVDSFDEVISTTNESFQEYNDDDFVAAESTSSLALQQIQSTNDKVDELLALVQKMGISYILELTQFSSTMISQIEEAVYNLNLAAEEAIQGNYTQAGQYIEVTNQSVGDANETNQSIVNLIDQYPDLELDANERYLSNLYLENNNAIDEALIAAQGYQSIMDQIQEDHEDFFE